MIFYDTRTYKLNSQMYIIVIITIVVRAQFGRNE